MATKKAKVQAAVALGLAVVVAAGWSWFRVPIRVRWLVHRGAPPAEGTPSREAVEGLRAMGREARQPLLDLILHSGEPWENKAWAAAVVLRSPFLADRELRDALKSPDPSTARAAAFALMDGQETESFEETRAEQMQRISGMRPPGTKGDGFDATEALPVLLDWVADGKDRHTGFAARLLGQVPPGDPRVPEALLKIVEESPDLLKDGTTDANVGRKLVVVDAIQSLLQYAPRNEDVVRRICAVLGRMQAGGMVDSTWDIQRYAMDLLELSRGRGVDYDVLGMLAKSESQILRQRLAGVLGDLQGPVSGLLEQLLADEHPLVRQGALISLANRRDPMVLRRARFLVEDSYIFLRSIALKKVGDVYAVDADAARALLPLMLTCMEEPWPGDPVPNYAAQHDGGVLDVIESCLVSMTRITGLHPGFDKIADLADHRKTAAVARAIAGRTEEGRRVLDTWAEVVTAEEPEVRIPWLVEHLEKDADPENLLRAMRELHRLTGRSDGFPEGVLPQTGNDTEARNTIRRWMKDGRALCVAAWRK